MSFDPWKYDVDGNCYIEKQEALQAISDYYAGLILLEQANEVISLYMGGARNPACVAPEIDYSGKNEWCAYRIYHEPPGREATDWVVTEARGKIGNLLVQLTKAGLAGVEATFTITTGGESYSAGEYIALEVLGWWQYGKYLTGICIYDYNKGGAVGSHKHIDISPGTVLNYQVAVIPGSGTLTKVWDLDGNLLFEDMYECDAKRILSLQTELEYWRYFDEVGGSPVPRAGIFSFAGEVSLDNIYREGYGWYYPADVLSFYLDVCGAPLCDPRDLMSYDHYEQGGSWIFKGRVYDEVAGPQFFSFEIKDYTVA